jgi:hypothetical protein
MVQLLDVATDEIIVDAPGVLAKVLVRRGDEWSRKSRHRCRE